MPGTAEPRGPVLEAGRRAGFKKCVFPLQNPPNFLRASALSEHVSPVVVIPAEASSPDSEPVLEKDDLMGMDASQQVRTSWEELTQPFPVPSGCREAGGGPWPGSATFLFIYSFV